MTSYVVGGSDVIAGLLPWMLRLERSEGGGSNVEHLCGAVLIDVNYALTSAGCVNNVDL